MTETNIGRQSGAESDAMARARHAAGSAADTASNLAGQASGFATKAASALASEAQHHASGLMQQQMEAGADYVSVISKTAHNAARDLEDEAPEFARLVHDVADRADRFAEDLRHRSIDEVFDMAWGYARRNPRMFLGGAVAVGFMLTRFAKSSAERSASRSRYERSRRESSQANRTRHATGSAASPSMSGSVNTPPRTPSGGASNA